jgi:hypothetical protein
MKEFERKIIAELLEESELKNIALSGAMDNEVVEFSGAGYFLTIKDPVLPKHRIVLDSPDIRGKLGGIEVGYLAFVENSELMLECYSYDQEILPKHRDQEFLRDAT